MKLKDLIDQLNKIAKVEEFLDYKILLSVEFQEDIYGTMTTSNNYINNIYITNHEVVLAFEEK